MVSLFLFLFLNSLLNYCNDWSRNSPTSNTCLPMSIYVVMCLCVYLQEKYLLLYYTHKKLYLGNHIITSPPLKRICPYVSDTLCLHNVKVGVFLLVGFLDYLHCLSGLSALSVLWTVSSSTSSVSLSNG